MIHQCGVFFKIRNMASTKACAFVSILMMVNLGCCFGFKLELNTGFFKLGKNLFDFDLLGRQGNSDLNEVVDPDTYRDLAELVTSRGYPVEEHDVITKDGYVLGIKRIPRGIDEDLDGTVRIPIYLHHGLLSSGCDWVMNGPNKSLGFLLADAGYDVWIGNARGNTYSKKHTKYTNYDSKFWQFSWDEIALYDLPAAIDHILEATEQEQLIYIGHSMGTTVGFAMLSELPEYNKKVKAFIALAPVITVGYINSPIKYLAPFVNDIAFTLTMMGQNEFLPNNILIHIWSDLFCGTQPGRELCTNVMFQMSGIEMKSLNESRLSVYAHHSPAGTSTMTVVHYAQMVNSRKFTKYDYGTSENMKVYGQENPPEFKVENINTPIALMWSVNDKLADPTDVAMLKPRIKNLIESYEIENPQFTHIDFIYGNDAKKYVYDKVLAILQTL